MSDTGEDAQHTGGDRAPADLLVHSADLLATCDDQRREIAGGWVAITGGLISAVGDASQTPPAASRRIDAGGCLVTPGLVNTHHHMYQNLTRSYAPALRGGLFDWLTTLYPLWARLDEQGAYLSAWVGLAELALGGCTTSTDHLYVHPRGAGDLISAEITAAAELGMRFHPTRGSMSLGQSDGGLPPDEVCQSPEEILAESERLVGVHHDRSPDAMVRIALAPCSPFSVSTELMTATAELAERLDVRLHTHLCEDPGEDGFCIEMFGMRPVDYFEHCGWGSNRSWIAHGVQPNAAEITRLGSWGTGVAHCPSSNLLLGVGLAPVRDLRAAGVPVGLGVDGSASTDSASMWTEARNALLVGRLRDGQRHLSADKGLDSGRPADGAVGQNVDGAGGGDAERGGTTYFSAREALDLATRGSAGCLGREGEIGELSPGACGDLVVWQLDGPAFAGALSDPIEAWLRCGPLSARDTIVAGRPVVSGGQIIHPSLDERLTEHRHCAVAMQRA
ncbi:MAG: amidohydrolase family protein [Acidimicrobiaceae bacterium]|nr:amidohydrolase family protein [Acidimicrobiaceae bacterium]MDE0496634.1 amidohydrolase family protein [Acidimicrobiaceae bacterium]